MEDKVDHPVLRVTSQEDTKVTVDDEDKDQEDVIKLPPAKDPKPTNKALLSLATLTKEERRVGHPEN